MLGTVILTFLLFFPLLLWNRRGVASKMDDLVLIDKDKNKYAVICNKGNKGYS